MASLRDSSEQWGGFFPLCSICRRTYEALPTIQARDYFLSNLVDELMRRLAG